MALRLTLDSLVIEETLHSLTMESTADAMLLLKLCMVETDTMAQILQLLIWMLTVIQAAVTTLKQCLWLKAKAPLVQHKEKLWNMHTYT